jgi:two-component system, NtrC family, response regulator PilR
VERRPAHSRSAQDPGAPPREARFSRSEGGRPWSVLVSDPDRPRRQLASRVIAECGAEPRWIEPGLSGVDGLPTSGLAVVAPGGRLSLGDPGIDAIGALTRRGLTVICYEHGAYAWPLGVQCRALLAGAAGLLDSTKPEFSEELRRLLLRFLRAAATRSAEEDRVTRTMDALGVVGRSPAMLSAFRWVLRVSRLSDLPALISGETGTGKQLLAHAIHRLDDKRRAGPFVAVNCGAINAGIAESELFGARRGAYTGAHQDRAGQIGELPGSLQVKLLRVVQESRVLAVGEDRELPVSVRIIAATNRDLPAMVREGLFREDLFHRLNVLSIHIPPLRDRTADVEPMIDHFLNKYRSLNPTGSPSVGPAFVEALTRVALPGNIRQLENLVRRALVNKDDDQPLTLSDLPPEVWRQLAEETHTPSGPPEGDDGSSAPPASLAAPGRALPSPLVGLLQANEWNLSRSMRLCERLLLEATLHAARGNQTHAARLLGITPRSVYNKIRKHNLHA